MRSRLRELRYFTVLLGSLLELACTQPEADFRMDGPTDPLVSWRDTAPKRAILDLVRTVAEPDGAGFVPPEKRIAVFDNDGTLWVEQTVKIMKTDWTQVFAIAQ